MLGAMIHVKLSTKATIENVDSEIVVVAGCALGLVAPRQPPHVLHVDPESEMVSSGVVSDDLLVSVDGQDTRLMNQKEVAAAIAGARSLAFQRPPPQAGDEDSGAASGREDAAGGTAAAAAKSRAARPVEDAPAGPKKRGKKGERRQRTRSRSRRRRRKDKAQAGTAPRSAAPPPEQQPPWSAPLSGPAAAPLEAEFRRPSWPPPHQEPPQGWHGPPRPPGGATGPSAGSVPYPGGSVPRGVAPPRSLEGPAPTVRPAPSEQPGPNTVVVERLPPLANGMNVLTDFFGQFGPVASLQINHERREAIVTFNRWEDADRALGCSVVLGDPSIGLRPWRSKTARPPEPERPSFAPSAGPPIRGPGPPGTFGPPGFLHASPPPLSLAGGGCPGPRGFGPHSHVLHNSMPLVSGKKRQKDELEDKRKVILQGLTDQLKLVMSKIGDPKTSEQGREKLQGILLTIKDKISALTPAEKKYPPPFRPPPAAAPAPPVADPKHKPCSLRLANLPEALRGNEARVRQALGEQGVEAVREWSEDKASCVVRFATRRPAELAIQAQRVWGFTATWYEGSPKAAGGGVAKQAPAAAPAASAAVAPVAVQPPQAVVATTTSTEDAAATMKLALQAAGADVADDDSNATEELEPDVEDPDGVFAMATSEDEDEGADAAKET